MSAYKPDPRLRSDNSVDSPQPSNQKTCRGGLERNHNRYAWLMSSSVDVMNLHCCHPPHIVVIGASRAVLLQGYRYSSFPHQSDLLPHSTARGPQLLGGLFNRLCQTLQHISLPLTFLRPCWPLAIWFEQSAKNLALIMPARHPRVYGVPAPCTG